MKKSTGHWTCKGVKYLNHLHSTLSMLAQNQNLEDNQYQLPKLLLENKNNLSINTKPATKKIERCMYCQSKEVVKRGTRKKKYKTEIRKFLLL